MQQRWDIGIGIFGLIFALLALFFWFPNDIKGDFMELTRAGKPQPGDAFFPVLITVFIGTISLFQILTAALRPKKNSALANTPTAVITIQNLLFLIILATIILGSLSLMYWLGPLAVSITGVADGYRQMLDTAPYKYIGIVCGGFAMTFTLITWAEGRIRPRTAIVSVVILLVLVLIFDVALTNISLPPNADF